MNARFRLAQPVILDQSASTNDDAFAMLKHQRSCVVWTLDQTGGRGSRGRQWITPKNHGLALSIGLSGDEIPHPTALCYPLFAGLLLYDSLARLLGLERDSLALKWPNDLLLKRRKLAGILCESRWSAQKPHIVLGIGVNLRSHQSLKALDKGFASLDEFASAPAPATIVHEIVLRFHETLASALDADWLHARWLARCWPKPGALLAVRAHGKRRRGVFSGLGGDGALLLTDGDGKVHRIEQSCDDFLVLEQEK